MQKPSQPVQAPRAAQRPQLGLRLESWHRRSIYACVAVLFATGAAWLIARYFFRPVAEFGETVHPLEPLAMKLHGAAAMATLFFLGTLLNTHIRGALKTGRNRLSGWSMVASMAVLTITGFGLYYLASESNRPVWSAVHWLLGIAACLLLVIHVLLGRRRLR